MSWIIIEGPTAVGKSTLHQKLTDRLQAVEPRNTHTYHMGQPGELTRRWALHEYVSRWEGFDHAGSHLLGDRHAWGELTYAPLYRPDTNSDGFGLLGRAGWRWTEMFLASRGAVVALLTADNDTLAGRLKTRGDDHVKSLEDLFQVSSLYNGARREAVTMGASFETSGEIDQESYDGFVDTLLDEAEMRAGRAAEVSAVFPKYIGSLRPDVLLVGDQRNPSGTFTTDLPFAPVDGNSGEYLLNALPDMFWRSVGIVNGCEDVDLPALYAALDTPRLVALGKNASRALTIAGFNEFGEVPHPQWVRRFKNAHQKDYGRAIVAAANDGEWDNSWTR